MLSFQSKSSLKVLVSDLCSNREESHSRLVCQAVVCLRHLILDSIWKSHAFLCPPSFLLNDMRWSREQRRAR
jgi:hypothetical protein